MAYVKFYDWVYPQRKALLAWETALINPAPVGGSGGSSDSTVVPTLTAQEKLNISTLETFKKFPPGDTNYPKLIINENYVSWVIQFHCHSKANNFDCVNDKAEKYNFCLPGLDQDLWLIQLNLLGLVLDTTLKNPMGETFV